MLKTISIWQWVVKNLCGCILQAHFSASMEQSTCQISRQLSRFTCRPLSACYHAFERVILTWERHKRGLPWRGQVHLERIRTCPSPFAVPAVNDWNNKHIWKTTAHLQQEVTDKIRLRCFKSASNAQAQVYMYIQVYMYTAATTWASTEASCHAPSFAHLRWTENGLTRNKWNNVKIHACGGCCIWTHRSAAQLQICAYIFNRDAAVCSCYMCMGSLLCDIPSIKEFTFQTLQRESTLYSLLPFREWRLLYAEVSELAKITSKNTINC